MMKLKKSWVVAAAATAAVSSSALAASVTVDRHDVNDGRTFASGFSGGEFQVVRNSGNVGIMGGAASPTNAPANSFQSFCLEVGETVTMGSSYNAQMNTIVISGTNNANVPSRFSWGGGRQTIAQGTAWLYSQFRAGTLTDINGDSYTYALGTGRGADAQLVQEAIWIFQNQLLADGNNSAITTNRFLLAALDALGGTLNDQGQLVFDANGNITNDGAGSGAFANYTGSRVRVLNLTNSTNNFQDMITIIPLPSGGGLAAAGLMGLVALRRRRA